MDRRRAPASESKLYLGVGARNLLAGAVVIVTLLLPRAQPFDMHAAAAGFVGLVAIIVLMLVLGRHPALRTRPAVVVGAIALDYATVGFAILATRDLASPLFVVLVVVMTFQVQTLRQRRWAIVSWAGGVACYATTSALLGADLGVLISHTWVFGGAAGVILMMQSFLVNEVTARTREAEELAAELARLAYTDPLTGLPNRRGLTDNAAQCPPGTVCLVMVDLDHFKAVNDRDGHIEGDRLLQRFGTHLAAEVRAPDVVSRFGGEEFCILAITTSNGALALVERVRSTWQDLGERVTFSAGIAEIVAGPFDLDELVARADVALYEAKANGRDRTVVAAAVHDRHERAS